VFFEYLTKFLLVILQLTKKSVAKKLLSTGIDHVCETQDHGAERGNNVGETGKKGQGHGIRANVELRLNDKTSARNQPTRNWLCRTE